MSVGSVLSGGIAQINPFDKGKTYGDYNNGVHAKPPAAPKVTPMPSYQPSGVTKIDTSGIDKEIAASNAQIKALEASLAAQPKLPFYNTSAAWATAQKQAAKAVNPVYVDKLNAYLKKENLQTAQQTTQTATNKAGITDALTQALNDIGTQRTRTGEDQATQIGDINQQETNFQTDEGTQFDRARAALLGEVANSGLTTSGLGKQQGTNAIADRNQASKEQEQQFGNSKRDVNTLATRTFADLSTSENRAQGSATSKTKQEDVNLKNYIDSAKLEENSFRTSNEADRLGAIAGETNNQYTKGVANFIQSLIGSGARSQDIALAQQIYG